MGNDRAIKAVYEGGALGLGTGLLIILNTALESVSAGEIIELRSCEESLIHDLPSWCRISNHQLLDVITSAGQTRFIIRKGEIQSVITSEKPDWGLRPSLRDGREFETRDWYLGRVADVPEKASPQTGFAPRGAILESGAPVFPFTINEKRKVWANSVAELYEQATANQWDASRDIPWNELPPLPDYLERAVCQIMTFLTENEYSALYVPGKFISQINPQYAEVVMFLCTQMMDEARHIEAFTKRALANGGGLQYSIASTQYSLKSLLDQEDFSTASFMLSLLGEGTFLDLLRFIEDVAPDSVTSEIIHRARVDETRHVHFGLAHIKYHLSDCSEAATQLFTAVKQRAQFLQSITKIHPMVQDALVILAAGSLEPKAIRNGVERVKEMLALMNKNRIKRMINAGFSEEMAIEMSNLHTPNFM